MLKKAPILAIESVDTAENEPCKACPLSASPDRPKVSMTPKACFNFCRTVPGMLFFGLIYGRDCYCTPYFTPTTAGGNKDSNELFVFENEENVER